MQALALLNDTTYVEAAIHLAAKALKEKHTDNERLMLVFRTATSRTPDARELKVLADSLANIRTQFLQHPEMATQLLETGVTKAKSNLMFLNWLPSRLLRVWF